MPTASDDKKNPKTKSSKTKIVEMDKNLPSANFQIYLTKDTFEGWLDITYHHSGTIFTLTTVQYKIYKGNHTGGNKANINITLPNAILAIDNGIQNNAWQSWTSSASVATSTSLTIKFQIIFDRDAARDPRADITYRFFAPGGK